MLMGSKRFWNIIFMMIWISLSLSFVHGSGGYNRDSLDVFIHHQAYRAMVRQHTGRLYNISLPGNFSGMEASVVRVRSGSFRRRGGNFSFFRIPPRVIPMPFVTRLDIVFQNLGKWSSHYYNVPNHTLVTPIVGFKAYDSTENRTLDLVVTRDPIIVRFPKISMSEGENVTMKCVSFHIDGSIVFSNVIMSNSCMVRGQGHFCIVVRSSSKKKKGRFLKWWVVGFGVGVVGLVVLGLVVFFILKVVRVKRIGKMERQSERAEALDTVWVGRSRMPSAAGIRTQPAIENDYVP